MHTPPTHTSVLAENVAARSKVHLSTLYIVMATSCMTEIRPHHTAPE